MGAALAYWLTRMEPTASVTVIERDPSYACASSALSAASIRQQFTSAINILISQKSIALLRSAREWLAVDGEAPDIGLRERGYLYLKAADGRDSLEQSHAVQRALGVDVALLNAAQLANEFPWLNVSDLALGSLGLQGEGWFDGYTLLMSFIRRARHQGAHFARGEVVAMDMAAGRIGRVRLSDGTQIDCGYAVNAAGPWARSVARMAGVELPVFARRRTVYVIRCPERLEPFPLVIDPSGFWIRPEGEGFIAGLAPAEDPDDAPLVPDYGAFEEVLWPALATRIPAFESARLERAWAGYYEMNTVDHNGIVGFHPEIGNLAFMNGFSGHGIMQAPVIGLGVAELILRGSFRTLDLSELGFARLLRDQPLPELNVIG
jgi:FAD-dependent oxidoreductase domain-containing protein 1